MKNQIIDGVEHAVNLKGELYEVMIPGTKCPVSAGVLGNWYFSERMTLAEIADRIYEDQFVRYSVSGLWKVFNNAGIKRRGIVSARKIAKEKGHLNHIDYGKGLRNFRAQGRKPCAPKSARVRAGVASGIVRRRNMKFINCAVCNTLFHLRKQEIKCCSDECGKVLLRQTMQRKFAVQGLTCPRCFYPSVYCKKDCNSRFVSFCCAGCRRHSVRPIIERGLRRDLEAAGALDDGRILVSAFVEQKAEVIG